VAGGCAPRDLAHALSSGIELAWKARVRACNGCAVESSPCYHVTMLLLLIRYENLLT
jgi:hypothetical protein